MRYALLAISYVLVAFAAAVATGALNTPTAGGSLVSPFQVYFVMQLDDFKTVVAWLIALAGAASVGWGIIYANTKFPVTDPEELKVLRRFGYGPVAFFLFVALQGITPTTRTGAAMFVLPALTSEKAQTIAVEVGSEVKDFVDIAKQALRQKLLDPPKEETRK